MLLAGNYGHFTSMLVRDGRVRGLGAHLDRLAHGNRVLFGTDLDVEVVRDYLRRAVTAAGARTGAVTARVAVLGDPAGGSTEVLVTVRPPSAAPATAVRLRSVRHERTLPEVKHVGTFDLHHHARQARLAGFDDALFVTAHGRVSETSIRNIGFLDSDTGDTGGTGGGSAAIVWPEAPALAGVTQRLLTEALARLGVATRTRPVPLADVTSMRGAFVCNAGGPVVPVTGIDDMAFSTDTTGAMSMLAQAYDSTPYEPV